MGDPEDGKSERRRHQRTPLSMLVQYRFDTFEDFLAEYSLNLSPGGMFICTEEPGKKARSSTCSSLSKTARRLIEGMGRVVRVNPTG